MKNRKTASTLLLTLIISLTIKAQNNPSPFIGTNHSRGNTLLILRLAVSCPGEYTQQVGGVANAKAYITTWRGRKYLF